LTTNIYKRILGVAREDDFQSQGDLPAAKRMSEIEAGNKSTNKEQSTVKKTVRPRVTAQI